MKRHQPRPLDAVAIALMVVLCLSWGLNQVAIKLALPEIPPMTQGALRSLGALPVVLIIARLRGVPLTARDGTLVAGLAAGALFGLEFICIYAGLVWTTASRGVVFVYVGPFLSRSAHGSSFTSGSCRYNGAGSRWPFSASSLQSAFPTRRSRAAFSSAMVF
jgi:hypothetical protein